MNIVTAVAFAVRGPMSSLRAATATAALLVGPPTSTMHLRDPFPLVLKPTVPFLAFPVASLNMIAGFATATTGADGDKTKASRKKRAASRPLASYGSYKEALASLPEPTHSPPAKRPSSAYIFFMKEQQESYFRDDPSLKTQMAAVAKRGGAAWRALSESDREPYQRLADEAKDKYQKELERYMSSRTQKDLAIEKERNSLLKKMGKKGVTRKVLLKDAGRPKGPVTGFFRFLADVRKGEQKVQNGNGEDADIGVLKPKEVTALAGKAWKGLGESEKKAYIDAYKQEKAEHKDKLADYIKDFKDAQKDIREGISKILVRATKSISVAKRLREKQLLKMQKQKAKLALQKEKAKKAKEAAAAMKKKKAAALKKKEKAAALKQQQKELALKKKEVALKKKEAAPKMKAAAKTVASKKPATTIAKKTTDARKPQAEANKVRGAALKRTSAVLKKVAAKIPTKPKAAAKPTASVSKPKSGSGDKGKKP